MQVATGVAHFDVTQGTQAWQLPPLVPPAPLPPLPVAPAVPVDPPLPVLPLAPPPELPPCAPVPPPPSPPHEMKRNNADMRRTARLSVMGGNIHPSRRARSVAWSISDATFPG